MVSECPTAKREITGPNENSQKASITGPNENSQKASISVNVLAANSQDEVYEGTTRPRPESDKQTRKLDDEMNDIETVISAPNENSQKASKSVNVLAAGSQDRICVNEHKN